MSVSFDVLDSLYSIRNVEDLKKRWEEDSKRPQTLSYKAVEKLCEWIFKRDEVWSLDPIIQGNFAMRYREAVEESICVLNDQEWIMPYVRYIECSKSISWLSSRFNDLCLAFDAIEEFEKNSSIISKKDCKAIIKLLSHLFSIDYDLNCSLEAIVSPEGYNPWDLNPNSDYFHGSDEDNSNSYDPFYDLLYHLEDNRDTEFLAYAEALWKSLEKIIEIKGENFLTDIPDIVSMSLKTLEKIKNADSRFQSAMNEYRHFKEVKNLLRNDELPAADRLAQIARLGFPHSYKLKLTYMVEPLVVEYIKGVYSINLSKAELTNLFERLKSFKHIIADDLFKWLSTTFFNAAIYESAIREDERKKVLFEMSHSIKNLTASVTEPLEMMLGELSGHHRRTVENALAGAGLIRDLAVGVHMSMRGEIGVWRKDVKEPGFGAAALDKIILDALRHAVSNMFDGKYFNLFVRNYFGRDLEKFMQAQAEWKAAASAKEIFDCINKYFFDFTLDHGDTELNIPVGDRDGTASKLLIFFQELLLNAVKYSSFTEREKRFVKINISITDQQWDFTIANSSGNRQNAKSSGIGLEVIKNFAALFEAEYKAGFENDSYVSKIKFFLNK